MISGFPVHQWPRCYQPAPYAEERRATTSKSSTDLYPMTRLRHLRKGEFSSANMALHDNCKCPSYLLLSLRNNDTPGQIIGLPAFDTHTSRPCTGTPDTNLRVPLHRRLRNLNLHSLSSPSPSLSNPPLAYPPCRECGGRRRLPNWCAIDGIQTCRRVGFRTSYRDSLSSRCLA